jgi:hypothetical protein
MLEWILDALKTRPAPKDVVYVCGYGPTSSARYPQFTTSRTPTGRTTTSKSLMRAGTWDGFKAVHGHLYAARP